MPPAETPRMGPPTVARQIAAELRAHPEHWTQGVFARDATGTEVPYDSSEATC
jgi:hypothetical protein